MSPCKVLENAESLVCIPGPRKVPGTEQEPREGLLSCSGTTEQLEGSCGTDGALKAEVDQNARASRPLFSSAVVRWRDHGFHLVQDLALVSSTPSGRDCSLLPFLLLQLRRLHLSKEAGKLGAAIFVVVV